MSFQINMDSLFQDIIEFKFDHGSVPMFTNHDLVNIPDGSASPPGTSFQGHRLDNIPFANEMLKYINQMLMEEDLQEKSCMLQDCLALQAAEESFYDVLGHQYPLPVEPISLFPDDNPTQTTRIGSINSHITGTDSVTWRDTTAESFRESSPTGDLAPQSSLSPLRSKGRKNYRREDGDYLEEGTSSKQSAISLEDSEQLEMYDEVLLCKGENEDYLKWSLHGNSQLKESTNGGTVSRRKNNGKKREVVDLSSLLTQCAQSVAIDDQRTANELLKQIRQHSYDTGDGTQRLAYYFAKALKTRLAGLGAPSYLHLLSNKTSAADVLKAYGVYVSACPFKKMSNFYANKKIMGVAETAITLHIVDFGICYGFQWPCLIRHLSTRSGGPPKLRITGIEFPQPGPRPAEKVEETGRRLKRYCERFNVPFEYTVIAKKWESIRLKELKINKGKVVVVNCMYRLKNLPDDTMASTSARDTLLKLIRSINPELFIHGIENGTYNAPFFVTRFREALFHFSAKFDIFEANVSREDPGRMMFEKEVLGRDVMNVIACEGSKRVERPETYKQWQARTVRSGFKQVPLDKELVKKVRNLVQCNYHRDFGLDLDGHWMLQVWKGRVIYALSCWKPASNEP
ncbi:Scarecrow-like protein 14 [Hibiscus syriacus]|uniref:Scarecrow-like protein 14 n=1 Tax=Hibiscus syriacus TaxID=106335 RepID=A0A6A2ZYR1_HIBSY|nr:scarecrow-like protein 30 [Hibiscus syriacus]KAE8696676.1 Scarecrow-like protein 14 [Hibiscus syriacus]